MNILIPSPKFFLIKALVPIHNSWPLLMMDILSANLSASSRKWVVRMMVLFSFLICSRMSHIAYLLTGSKPLVGSSKYTILLPPIRLIPNDSFLLNPPDNIPAALSLSDTKLHLLRISSTSFYKSFSSTCLICPTNLRCSSTVRLSYKISF